MPEWATWLSVLDIRFATAVKQRLRPETGSVSERIRESGVHKPYPATFSASIVSSALISMTKRQGSPTDCGEPDRDNNLPHRNFVPIQRGVKRSVSRLAVRMHSLLWCWNASAALDGIE